MQTSDWFSVGSVVNALSVLVGLLLGVGLLGKPSTLRMTVIVGATMLVAFLYWQQGARDARDKRLAAQQSAVAEERNAKLLSAALEVNTLLRSRLPEPVPPPQTAETARMVAVPHVYYPDRSVKVQTEQLVAELDSWIAERRRQLPSLETIPSADALRAYRAMNQDIARDYSGRFAPRVRFIVSEARRHSVPTQDIPTLNDHAQSLAEIEIITERLRALVGSIPADAMPPKPSSATK